MADVNVRGTRNLSQAAAGKVKRWVQLSSVGAYGPRRAGTITEDEPLRPEGAYEVTKTEAEQKVLRDAARLGFECCVLRPCKIMSIGMRDRSLYSLFSLIARGRFFFIGRPGALLNYVHVDDVARALVLCATHPGAAGRVYNVARRITVEDFVAAACAAIGCKLPVLRLPEGPVRLLATLTAWLPGNPLTVGRIDRLTSRLVYASDRIGAELGYRFEVAVEDGLRELVEDWRRAA
jgi:nucleoside-diphosphate-sugar epimerase